MIVSYPWAKTGEPLASLKAAWKAVPCLRRYTPVSLREIQEVGDVHPLVMPDYENKVRYWLCHYIIQEETTP